MDFELKFRNSEQERFYFSTARNSCFSGGFGNGKTYVACQRAFTLLSTFPKYRYAIARKTYKHLRTTTMETFFKICPLDSPFITKHEPKEGYTNFRNGSRIYWLHLDLFDEDSLRGLEINSVLIDQAEEIDEAIYLVLDARIGRWDGAEVPEKLLKVYEDSGREWPRDDMGRCRVPNRHDILVNPESEFHWVYKRYHIDSIIRKTDHFFIERETDPKMYDPATYREMASRAPEWVERYLKGKWGASASAIHFVSNLSIISTDNWMDEQIEEIFRIIKSDGALYRVLDHGDAAPTCCLWFAAISNIHICYREYYVPNAPISYHRQNINDLTEDDEEIIANYADPSVTRKASQKDGGFWTIQNEYTDENYTDSPPILWQPADNNEFATRNRINELLMQAGRNVIPSELQKTLNPGNISTTPALFFLRKSKKLPQGCDKVISETAAQRKKEIGSENGKAIYSDDRDKGISDHGYDTLRYYVAMHFKGLAQKVRTPPKRSFETFNRILLAKKNRRAIPV